MQRISLGNFRKILPQWYAGIFMAILFFPLLAALIFDFESWPLTSAPMFAHYVDEKTPLYRFRFTGVFKRSPDRIIQREIRLPSVIGNFWFDFYFFGKVYGSIDEASPFGKHPGETKDAFESRLTRFFRVFLKNFDYFQPLRLSRPTGIQLDVVRLDQQMKDQEAHTVGYFDTKTGVFTHQWKR